MAILQRYLNVLNGWEKVAGAVQANATELAHLEARRAKLEALLAQARTLTMQQATLTATKQEVSTQLLQVIRQGDALVDFLRTGAREHFGKESEKVVEFGVQPFRRRTRPAATQPPDTPAPQTPSPEAPQAPVSTSTPETTK